MCPSPPPFGIGLGPTNPSMISIAKETLFFRRARLSLALRLLVPTFSLPHAPPWVAPLASSLSGTLSYYSCTSLRSRYNPRLGEFSITSSRSSDHLRDCKNLENQRSSRRIDWNHSGGYISMLVAQALLRAHRLGHVWRTQRADTHVSPHQGLLYKPRDNYTFPNSSSLLNEVHESAVSVLCLAPIICGARSLSE